MPSEACCGLLPWGWGTLGLPPPPERGVELAGAPGLVGEAFGPWIPESGPVSLTCDCRGSEALR